MSTFLGGVGEAVYDAVPDLAAPCPRERLARRTACDELYPSVLDELSDARDALRRRRDPS